MRTIPQVEVEELLLMHKVQRQAFPLRFQKVAQIAVGTKLRDDAGSGRGFGDAADDVEDVRMRSYRLHERDFLEEHFDVLARGAVFEGFDGDRRFDDSRLGLVVVVGLDHLGNDVSQRVRRRRMKRFVTPQLAL